MRQLVKESYGKRWAGESEKCCEENRLLSHAHDGLIRELSPRKGMFVLDVGSGTGNTVVEIAQKVKPTGKAVGVDFTREGIAKARKKAKKLGLEGVAEFRLSDAEKLPFEDGTFDAVISECVVSLTLDKKQVLNEKVRVLKPGGRVIMHDVVTSAPMPEAIRNNPKLYCGCIGGAVSVDDYKDMMKDAGLVDIKIADYSKETAKSLNAAILGNASCLPKDKSLDEIANFLRNESIGYALLVGTKER